jgi:tetratricopeptide (TPR) repeat protein
MQGRDAEAKQWLERGLAEWRRTGKAEDQCRTEHALGTVLRALGDYGGAESFFRSALGKNPADPITRSSLNSGLADLLREQGKFDEARAHIAAAAALGELHWRLVAERMLVGADIDRESGQYAAALTAWQKCLEIARDHQDSTIEAVALRGLGETELAAGNAAAAEPSLRKSLAIFETSRDAHQIASTLTCLAELYLVRMKPAMAEEALRRAVDLDDEALGRTHPQVAVLLQMRADAASRLGAFARARADLDRAWAIVKGSFGENSAVGGAFLANRGTLELRAGDQDAAIRNYQRATEILRKSGPEARGVTASLLENYANLLRSLHRNQEAKALKVEAKSFR